MFRHLGIEPCEQRIIALKSSVHFRNDFQHFATAVLSVIAPGPVSVDLTRVPFSDSRLRGSRKKASNLRSMADFAARSTIPESGWRVVA